MYAGIQSHQDLTHPEYWGDTPPTIYDIIEELAEKYYDLAYDQLADLVEAGEIDSFAESEVYDLALDIAQANGETPDRIMNRLKADRAEWLAGFYDNDY